MIDIFFQNKPISTSIKHNSYYKLIILIALLNYCARSKRGSLLLVHLIFWSLRNTDNYKVLLDFSKGNRQNIIPWSFEIGIDQVLSLGYIYKFIDKEIVTDTLEVKITEQGEELLKNIEKEKLFEEDINKIKALGQIPKTRINKANNNWSLL